MSLARLGLRALHLLLGGGLLRLRLRAVRPGRHRGRAERGLGALLSGLTAYVIERDATPATLGVLMLACVLLSLAAALAAIRMDPQA
jgi:hypothetical protein